MELEYLSAITIIKVVKYLSIFLFITVVFGAPSINLNIFNPRGLRLVHEHIVVSRQIPEFEYLNAQVIKFNRTTPVVNVEFKIHDPKAHDFKVWFDGYEKLGMEHIYTKSAITVTASFCDLWTNHRYLMNKGFLRFGNIPSSCPLKKDHLYYLHNFVIEEDTMPPAFPGNRWRLDVQIGPEGSKNTKQSNLLQYFFRVERFNRKSKQQS